MRNSLTAALAALGLTFVSPALADEGKKQKPQPADLEPRAVPRDDHGFAMLMIQHHKDGMALADAVIANGTSEDVRAIARRIKADQQKDIAMLDRVGHKKTEKRIKMATPPKDPDMERGMADLKAAKGADADRLFLTLMITHHASGVIVTHGAQHYLQDEDLKSKAGTMFSKQAREIGELQRLREAERAAQK